LNIDVNITRTIYYVIEDTYINFHDNPFNTM